MQWKNKGHEYDLFWREIKDIQKVYLFGAGLVGKSVFELLQNLLYVKSFVDNDANKQGTIFEGKRVISVNNIKMDKNTAVLICVSPESVDTVIKQMNDIGVRTYDVHIFLPVFYMYHENKLLLTSISYLPTTVCNLCCKNCLNFAPFLKNQSFRDIAFLKSDIDVLFKKVDYILLFHISGGEPFLYPGLAELFHYICHLYRNKIGRLETTTNGTVLPSNELCKTLSKLQVGVVLDDYRDAVPQYSATFDKIIEKFKHYKINYRVQKVDSWIALDPKDTNVIDSDEGARRQFENCHVPWQEYRSGKLYLCNYSDYAAVAGKYEVQQNEYIEIATSDKREIMEFRLGYSEKGYVNFCKRCAGFFHNPNIVKPAEQI